MISLLCPSRGRPTAAAELLTSFLATKRADSQLIFCLDSDDPTFIQYPKNRLVGKGSGDPVGPLNDAARISTAGIVGFIGDDSRFETDGWDVQVIEALVDPGFCWTDDGHEVPWPSTVFVSKCIVDALGWLALPTLKRGYFDTVWVDLADGGLPKDPSYTAPLWTSGFARVLLDVMIRHDNTTHEEPSTKVIYDDAKAYELWRDTQMAQDRKTVRSAAALARFF